MINLKKHGFALIVGTLQFIAVLALITSGGNSIINIFGAFLVALFGFLSILFYKYGYIFVPLVTKFAKVVLITDTGYEIPPEQDVIVKKDEDSGLYYASAFLGIRIFESMMEKTTEEIVAYNQYFERAISNLRFVMKLSYLLYVEDVEAKRQAILAKKMECQLRLQRERQKPNPDEIVCTKLEREIAKWERELDKLIKGYRPMAVIAYAMTTATGVTKEAAMDKVRAQAKELEAILTNALNVKVEKLTGDEMLKAFKWEKFLPPTLEEAEEEVD